MASKAHKCKALILFAVLLEILLPLEIFLRNLVFT